MEIAPVIRDWQNKNIILEPLPTEQELDLDKYRQDPVVLASLNKLNDSNFVSAYGSETYGGNAGYINIDGNILSCKAINGYANRVTGQIAAFGNPQYLDTSITNNEQYAHFQLRFAVPKASFKRFIIGRDYEDGMTPEATERLDAAILLDNEGADERAERAKASFVHENGSRALELVQSVGQR